MKKWMIALMMAALLIVPMGGIAYAVGEGAPAAPAAGEFIPGDEMCIRDRIKDLKVNGKSVSSRCPVSVPASGKTTIEVTGPDGSTKATYTLTFVVG